MLPKPAKRLDVWLGGKAPSELRRVGKLADGWLASFSSPEDCKTGRDAIEEATAAAGRSIDDDHFGAMVFYTHDTIPRPRDGDAHARNPGADPNDLVANGWPALRELCERYVAVGFSKLVLVPFTEPDELGRRARAGAEVNPPDPERKFDLLTFGSEPQSGYASRKRRRPIIEPATPITAPIEQHPAADDEHVVGARVERLEQVVLVLQQLRDEPLQEVHEPEREAGADRALHEPFGHERHAHEPVRRADELHHLDLAPARERREADRVHDQEQRRRQQHAGHRDEGEPDPAGRGQQALDLLLRGGDDGVDAGLAS